MKRFAVTALATALIAASGSAFAYDQDNGYDRYDSYNDGNSAAYSDNYSGDYRNDGPRYDTAQVLRVDPIIDRYRSESRQHCWIEQSRYDQRYDDRRYSDRRGNTSGALLGAVIGGALGNQVGHGDGRTAATIAGAVIGGSIGNHVDRDGHYDGYSSYNGYGGYRDGSVRRCESVGDGYGRDRYDDRVIAYNVTYRYAGQVYHTVTNYHPGNTLRVSVNVQPTDRGVAYR